MSVYCLEIVAATGITCTDAEKTSLKVFHYYQYFGDDDDDHLHRCRENFFEGSHYDQHFDDDDHLHRCRENFFEGFSLKSAF